MEWQENSGVLVGLVMCPIVMTKKKWQLTNENIWVYEVEIMVNEGTEVYKGIVIKSSVGLAEPKCTSIFVAKSDRGKVAVVRTKG